MGAGGRTTSSSTIALLAGEAMEALAAFSSGKPAPREQEVVGERKQTKFVDGSVTMEEVAKHNTRDDAWLVVKGKVYDVTELAKNHPGGSVIYSQLGKDVTDVFSLFHDSNTWKILKELYVADLEPEALEHVEDINQSELLRDFRSMRIEMLREGLFESSKFYYAFKIATNVMILISSLLCLYGSCSWTSIILSSSLLGLFWQQCGWLAHDFLHHQVFKNRKMNNFVGLILGNVAQGFSSAWWKDKHNTHHAAPNELDDSYHAVDPDIDTLPLIAWSEDMLNSVESRGGQVLVAIQHYLFFPILFLARMSWAQQSLAYAADSSTLGKRKSWEESALLWLHYAWYLGVSFSALPFLKACAFLFMSQLFAGVLLSIVFVQSHNAKEVYAEPKDFVSAQIVSTRDINGGLFNDWFTGGLNRQIEHHLFPTMPRHNLGKAQERVKTFCMKHGLYYEECSMLSATGKVMALLKEIALTAQERLRKAQ